MDLIGKAHLNANMVHDGVEEGIEVDARAMQDLVLGVQVVVVFNGFFDSELLSALFEQHVLPEVVSLVARAEYEIEHIHDEL